MSQQVILRAKGLYTFPNKLSQDTPAGALSQAENVIINRESVVEPRRGFALYGSSMGSSSSTDISKQLLVYKGRILRHYSDIIQFDDGAGTFTSFAGSYSQVSSDARIKSLESNGNLYFTTSKGIKKISAKNAAGIGASSIENAGGIGALDLEATLNTDIGFFSQESVVAYRVFWGIKDANSNVILGKPSERAVIYNSLTDLLIKDFNNLLVQLDNVNNSGGISDANYVSTLKVPLNSSASTLRSNLISLANKLDNDAVITEGSIDTASTQRISSTSGSIVFNSDITTFIAVGDVLSCTGLNNSELNSNDLLVVSISGTTTVNFIPTTNFTANDGSSVADVGTGVVKRKKYSSIALSTDLSETPTSEQLLSMQSYYDSIVSNLQFEPAGIITSTTPFDTVSSTQSSTTNLTFTVPDGITTNYFYQVYRTALSTSSGATQLSDLDPGDEVSLVLEDNPTSSQISARSVTIHDIVPDSFRGANAYTNPISGEGILKSNEVPPLAQDLALYKGFSFYANTTTKHKKQFNLLSVTDMVSGASTFTVTDGTTTNTYTFVNEVAQVTRVTTVADVASSLNNKHFPLYSAYDTSSYYVWYNVSGAGVDPAVVGATGIEVSITVGDSANTVASLTKRAINQVSNFSVTVSTNQVIITNSDKGIASDSTSGNTGFTVTTLTQGAGEDASNKKVILSNLDTPSQEVDETARSLVRVINKNSSEIVVASYLSGVDDIPGIIYLEAKVLGADPFYLNVESTATGSEFSPTLPISGNSESSDDEVSPNRIYWSKQYQPDSVPIINYQDIGPKDKKIIRIIALRDSLFILKEEAVYRLSGETEPFFVTIFDNSTNIFSSDSAVVLNNLIYMFSTQGVGVISDTGIQIISRPIENLLIKLLSANYSNTKAASFGIGYESDRSYYLFTPTATTDTQATQCFRYNTFTSTWTILKLNKTCGIINPLDDKMYLGAGDINYIERERKSFDRTDYCDRTTDLTLSLGSVNEDIVNLDSLTNISVGDTISQTQRLTISQFNRLLSKLDLDNGVSDEDYYDMLFAIPGNDLKSKLDSLAVKLDADSGISSTNYYSSISGLTNSMADSQIAFNLLTAKLNLDSTVVFSNYPTSSGTVEYEVIITEIDKLRSTITTESSYPFVVGEALVYRHFTCKVEWSPQAMGDPSSGKQVSEATTLFENNAFSTASMAYASDLSPEFEEQEFQGLGNGSFGSGTFGDNNFGGEGNGVPFRTYVPLAKQRCRYLSCRFTHAIARETFALYGISLNIRDTGTRAWR